jgi:hypothetical protein
VGGLVRIQAAGVVWVSDEPAHTLKGRGTRRHPTRKSPVMAVVVLLFDRSATSHGTLLMSSGRR